MKTYNDYLSEVEQIFADEKFLAEPRGLYEPIDYTLRLGGKRIRPTLLLIANALFGGDTASVRHAALGIETFHNFTLLHDDLMDRSPLRRGQPTVYTRWNDNTAILSGDTMYALAWRYFLRQPSPRMHEALQCFNETAIEVCEGQQYDMDFERRDDVTIDQYMMMIRKKTAVLLAGALKIGALYAGAAPLDADTLYRFGIHLGLAFQLDDDRLDAYGDTSVFGKKTGQDIRDNKKTFLFLRALELASRSNPDAAARLRQLFASRPADEEQKVGEVLDIYRSLGMMAEVAQAIDAQNTLALRALDSLRVDDALKLPLRQLTESLMGRKK